MTAAHHDPAIARLIEQARAEGAAEALRSAASSMLATAANNRDRSHWRATAWSHWLRERADQIGGPR